MAVAVQQSTSAYINIAAGVAISGIALPTDVATEIKVYYGIAGLLAVLNTDYTIAIEGDLQSFALTPTASLLTKINALITADPTHEVNRIVVSRELPLTSVATQDSVSNTQFLADQFDRRTKVDQQIQAILNRAIVQTPTDTSTPLKMKGPYLPGRVMMTNEGGYGTTDGPTAAEINLASSYAEQAMDARDVILAIADALGLPPSVIDVSTSINVTNAAHKWRILNVIAPSVKLTVAAAASLDSDFKCYIYNSQSAAAVRVVAGGGEFPSFWLKPKQKAVIQRLPASYLSIDRHGRLKATSNINVYCADAPNGGHVDNDGLHPTRPTLTLNDGKQELIREYDFAGYIPTLYGTGAFTEALGFAQDTMIGYSALNLKGYNSTKFTLNGVGGYAVQIGNGFRLITDYMKIQALATSGWLGFALHQTSVLDVGTNMEFGAFPDGAHIDIDTEGKVNYFGNHTISGNALAHTRQRGHSAIWYSPGTRTMVGTPAFSYFHDIIAAGAEIFYNGTVTTSGAVTAASKYRVWGKSDIALFGNTVPGTAPGVGDIDHGGEVW